MSILLSELSHTFLLGFSSLFPLINPIGSAFIIQPYFAQLDDAARKRYSLRIVLICFLMGLAALHLGSYVLKLMGVSIPATQTAGGIVIAILGFNLLNSGSAGTADVVAGSTTEDNLFYPLSFPLILGPGSISTLIALSAHVHMPGDNFWSPKVSAITLSLVFILVIAYFCFVNASRLVRRLGHNGSQVINRMMSFLLFCVGIQMAFAGVMGLIKAAH